MQDVTMSSTSQSTLDAYVAATKSADLEAVMDFVADDAVYLFSNESSHIGRAAVRVAIAHNFSAIEGESYDVLDVRWLANTPDAAACVYRYEWSGRIGGEFMKGGGRGTCVLRCHENRWLIVHEHLSRGGLK